MINLKKMTAILLAAGFLCNPFGIYSAELVRAEEAKVYEQALAVPIDNLDEYNTKAELSWSCGELVSTNMEKVTRYSSFTLEENSVVKIGVKWTEIERVDSFLMKYKITVYSDEVMTKEILEFDKYEGEPKTVYLPAGTYYMEAVGEGLAQGTRGIKADIFICTLPANKILEAVSKQDKNKSKAIVAVTQAFGADLENIQYVYGAYYEKDNTNHKIWKTPYYKGSNSYYTHIATELTNGNTFTVKKNGTYTIRVITKDGTAYSIQHKVKGLDNTAPKVTGVKNGKTYKKAVTICFSDKGSGIKSVKLNGKTIASGKKVSKKGKYTLKVTDKANNTKIVKFKIKK